MAKLNPYLNFNGTCEEAFLFYQSVFGGEFLGGILRMNEMPGNEELREEDKRRVMHIALPIGVDLLMGSDTYPGGMQNLIEGNNNSISIFPETKEEADRLFNGLSEGGVILVPIQDVFWGDYYGQLKDKFGIFWMINYTPNNTTLPQ
ncbi:conserved hypothetical protein [uncultured Paludibacter sp.]|uniref:PhnB-like domain-containing protein n=1 Tax=uncultured Paludibacter sp. TaxID=497635 RepID=A0A653AJS1_9BACT|nr:conserved hypothetical protein [uncultured Paludibacter sp.]